MDWREIQNIILLITWQIFLYKLGSSQGFDSQLRHRYYFYGETWDVRLGRPLADVWLVRGGLLHPVSQVADETFPHPFPSSLCSGNLSTEEEVRANPWPSRPRGIPFASSLTD